MTWEEVQREIAALAAKVDVAPDIIVGIVRGGLVPSRLLASALGCKNMYGLTVKKVHDKRVVTSDITEDLTGKHMLLVEDMLETGMSLITAKEYLEQKGAIVKTACLYTMPISEIKPDYSLREINDVIHFPWE